ncbi:MAG: uroporphyrinogen decarboxylase family protein [Pseudomonadota bacterium]
MGLFNNRPQTAEGKTRVPLWFMRQAGRYHDHYQKLRTQHDFMTLCKNPPLAAEVTMGPIDSFGFDAAILFSDLLFPLENLGLGLTYEDGPPRLKNPLTPATLGQVSPRQNSQEFYSFQKKALELIRPRLPKKTDLLGFVGTPFTLYNYATAKDAQKSFAQFDPQLYEGFLKNLLPEVLTEMKAQASAGIDAICLFDSSTGLLKDSIANFKKLTLAPLSQLTQAFKKEYPQTKIVYYAKDVGLDHFCAIDDPHIDVLGIDWNVDLPQALTQLSSRYFIQGNFNPHSLLLPWPELLVKLEHFNEQVQKVKQFFPRWIMGLGHGVLQQTPEDNVLKTIEFCHRHLIY